MATLIETGEARHPESSDPAAATAQAGTQSRKRGWFSLRPRHWLWLLVLASGVAVLVAASTARSQEYTIEMGPYSLPAYGGHGEVKQPTPLALSLPLDGWLQGLRFELVDESGTPLPRGMLHHLNLMVPDRRELFSQIMLRVGAAGPETKPYGLPWFLGYRMRAGDSLLVTAMLHNPTPKTYENVKLRVHLEVTPAASSWIRPIGVQPVYLDVMPPAGVHAYDLPPGHSVKSWEGRPAVPARLLAAGGHLHQYGKSLRFEDVTTGELIWEARPELDHRRDVLSMPIHYFFPLGVSLDPAHRYRLTAEYDNPTGKVLPDGGMGALGGIVVPAGDNPWPGVARDDAEYQRDVDVHRTHGGSHHHMMHE
jgi:hypothetical protein